MGVDIGGPLLPIIDDPHLASFLEVAATSTRLVHIYVVELTAAAALLKKRKEEAEEFLTFVKACKKTSVVIEEIDEPEPIVPKRKSKRKKHQHEEQRKPSAPLLMLEWYPRDVEFEEFLTKSLEDKRREWKREEEAARKNLIDAFASCSAEGAQADAVDGVVGQGEVHACEAVVVQDVPTPIHPMSSPPTGQSLPTPIHPSVTYIQPEVEVEEDVEQVRHGEQELQHEVEVEAIVDPESVSEIGQSNHSHQELQHEDEAIVDPDRVAEMGQSIHSQDVQHVEAMAVDDTVYNPTLDFSEEPQCQLQSEVPIIEEMSDELLMSGFRRDVEHAGHEVHDGPEVEPQEEVYIPSFEYVPDGCHLHNEGPPTDDEDEEIDHFISLAHMCRDEQLFTLYYESIFQQQHASQEPENVDQPGSRGSEGSREKRRRKYSPYVENRNKILMTLKIWRL